MHTILRRYSALLFSWLISLSCVSIQGSELMSKHGINVPRGVAVGSVDEVRKTLRDVFPNQSDVMHGNHIFCIFSVLLDFRVVLDEHLNY